MRQVNKGALDNLGAIAMAVARHERAMRFLLTPGWRGLYWRFKWLLLGR